MKLVGLIGSHCALTQLWLGWAGLVMSQSDWDGIMPEVRGTSQLEEHSYFLLSFFNAGDLWHLSNEESVPSMVLIIMDPHYLECCCQGPAPTTLTFSRANAGAWRNSLQDTVRAWGATTVSQVTWADRPGPHFKEFLHGSITEATENQGKCW